MEFWLIMLIVFAVVAGVGGWAGVAAIQRSQLTGRQERWRELERRFHRVTLDAERYDRSPGDALAAPGWLDRSSPVVRGFSGTLKRAARDKYELEQSVDPAPGRRNQDSGSRDTASRLSPTEKDLESLELLVERVEDAYRDADRAVRTTGWSTPGALQVPHPQFLLDPRWGRPAVLPRLGAVTAQNAERSVKDFLDATYPLRREKALKALRERADGASGAYRAQKALEKLMVTQRYRVDRYGFLWPGSTEIEHWGVYRTFGRPADLPLDDAPPVEVANALWSLLPDGRSLTEDELLEEARNLLGANGGIGAGITQSLNEGIVRGVQSLPENVRKVIHDVVPNGTFIPSPKPRMDQRLREGLLEGLVTGRLQRTADGRICRLRAAWPSTYRR
jgi:hypothetical protein